MLDILKIIYQFEHHAATTLEISMVRRKLGYSGEKSYNSLIVQNGKRVKEYLNKEAIYSRESGEELFWGIFFDGEQLDGKTIVNTEVKVGKSSDSGGWSLSRGDLSDFLPIDDYEGNYPITVDGIEAEGRFNINARLFYKSDELKRHLEQLAEENPNQKIPIEIEFKDVNRKGFQFTLKKELIEAIETLYDDLEVKYPHNFKVLEELNIDDFNSLDDCFDEDSSDIEKEFDSFYEYLLANGYLFDKETIENYLLSLKVKPFAILTGNSGTGKTKLSQLFAQYLSLEDVEYIETETVSPTVVETEEEPEIVETNDFNFNQNDDNIDLEGDYFAQYSRKLNKSLITEGKIQISNLYPFKEYYGTCIVEINGVELEAKVRSENIVIFGNNPKIKNYIVNAHNNGQSEINFKINSSDVSKVLIEDYTHNHSVLEGEVTKTVFNRIKLPLSNGGFPGTTSDFYPIRYEVPCRIVVDDKIDGICTLRSYAWIELADKNSFEVQSLKNDNSFNFKIYLDTFQYNENQLTDFSTVGDYINYASFKNNKGLDLSENKLEEELLNKLNYILNLPEGSLDKESYYQLKDAFNLSVYDSDDIIEKKISDVINKAEDDNLNDSPEDTDSENNEDLNRSINENNDYEVVKTKKIINYVSSNTNYKIIPVGANWTENRNIVGYYNVITDDYQRTPAYDLIIESQKHIEEPHFLILDEMNLSHVERYFADFLSAIESGEKIPLYGEKDLEIPLNLFIIGTVNVDETTYMFSPKVLDRANVLEFKTYSAKSYMNNDIRLSQPDGNISYLENPLEGIEIRKMDIDELRNLFNNVYVDNEEFWTILSKEIDNFQSILSKSGFDFGFRVINEIVRFMAVAWEYECKPEEFSNWARYFDAQIKQKILPKLHGSEKIIGDTIDELLKACLDGSETILSPETTKYYTSAKKLDEMRKVLRKQRYVSFIN